MRKIVFERPDGGVGIITPAISVDDVGLLTEAQAVQRAMRDVPADALRVRVVEEADMPSDRTFRDAWKHDLTVDMPKAREIHRDRLRLMRAPLMAAADVEFMRALEDGTPTAPIVAKKRALRDAPAYPAIDAAQTPEELKAAVPQVLKSGVV